MAKYKLDELCEFITDGTHQTPEYCSEGGIIFLSSKDVTERKINWDDVKYIPNSLHEKLYKRLRPRKNDILLAKNGTTGVAAIVDKDEVFDVYVSLAVLRPLDTIYPKYLLYAINSPVAKRQFNGGLKGIGVPNLHLGVIRETVVNVAPRKEQEKICKILDKVATLIDDRKTELELLDNLVKARFVEMFGDPIYNDKGVERVALGKICEVGSSKRIFEREYVDSGVPFYRTKEIVELSKGNKISTELFIRQERFDEISKEYGAPKKNDLLISAVGTIGVIWIVDDTYDFYFKDGNLLRVSASESFNSVYMKYLLETLIANYRQQMSAGTAYAALTIAGLKQMLVYKVPLTLQNQFADFVHQVDKSKVIIFFEIIYIMRLLNYFQTIKYNEK